MKRRANPQYVSVTPIPAIAYRYYTAGATGFLLFKSAVSWQTFPASESLGCVHLSRMYIPAGNMSLSNALHRPSLRLYCCDTVRFVKTERS